MENRILIISSKEYVLLAATAGMHHMYGFDMEADSISHAEAVMSLQDLTNKGYIKSNGDKFIIVGEMKLIFSIITNSRTMMDIHKKSGRKCIIYIYNEAVKVSESLRRPSYYELSRIPLEDIWNNLTDEGWFG